MRLGVLSEDGDEDGDVAIAFDDDGYDRGDGGDFYHGGECYCDFYYCDVSLGLVDGATWGPTDAD